VGGLILRPRRLTTRDGTYVTTVDLPVNDPPIDLIIWHRRAFLARPDATFREATTWRCAEAPRPEKDNATDH
jgi:hypothetical protein